MICGIFLSYKYKVTPKDFQIACEEIKRIKKGGKKEDIDIENRKIIEALTGHKY
ncbi:hypothetical protein [Clostridium sp.]|uniref:hypothetical protein n=1 Tax=Clostridium sp. TaxID=1506 RepID=UPI001A5DE248|nr:hypothetical protein [Clostridium sp.]MBK5236312.1 hypothetical protein [Clostridium sp.]